MVQNTQTCASKASGEVGEFNLHLRLQTSFGTLHQCPFAWGSCQEFQIPIAGEGDDTLETPDEEVPDWTQRARKLKLSTANAPGIQRQRFN